MNVVDFSSLIAQQPAVSLGKALVLDESKAQELTKIAQVPRGWLQYPGPETGGWEIGSEPVSDMLCPMRERQVVLVLAAVDGGEPVHLCGICGFVLSKPGEPCPRCALVHEDAAAAIDGKRGAESVQEWLKGRVNHRSRTRKRRSWKRSSKCWMHGMKACHAGGRTGCCAGSDVVLPNETTKTWTGGEGVGRTRKQLKRATSRTVSNDSRHVAGRGRLLADPSSEKAERQGIRDG